MSDVSAQTGSNPVGADPWLQMLDDLSNGAPRIGSDGVLSDDEIDRLMGLASSADRRSGKDSVAESPNMTNGFSPAMRLVSETFIDALSRSMRQLVTGVIDVTLVDLSLTRLSIGLGSLPLPSLIAVMQSRALGGSGIMVIDGALAGSFIDMLMGGGQALARDAHSTRPFSSIEVQLFRRLADTTAQAFTDAFSEISKADFGIDRIETNPRYVDIGKPTDNAILLRAQVLFGRRGGMLDLILPLSLFGAIEHLIRPKDEEASVASDVDWRQHLVQSVARSSIGLEVVLADFQLPLRQVIGLAVGQTIPLGIDSSSVVSLQCKGNRLASGLMGRSRDHMALRLIGPVTPQTRMRQA